jgi:hypothetical protein
MRGACRACVQGGVVSRRFVKAIRKAWHKLEELEAHERVHEESPASRGSANYGVAITEWEAAAQEVEESLLDLLTWRGKIRHE